ncbi:16S rRNA (uracil(1498)-N(3))-methyltransferase [Micrococcoides hystricis]|uniref:Ribosomal RNA small subunit methyltransferase E n=1 Tax=Micrococcoides hystricis TaxID=1572761 RepID=A0ABV6P7E9_9MICC
MTLPLFYQGSENTFPTDSQTFSITGQPAHHAHNVVRLGAGDQIRYADGEGSWVDATITEVTGQGRDVSLQLQVDDRGTEATPTPVLHMIQALAKQDRDLQAVETATEYGVDQISPLQSERCIVRWKGNRAAKSHQKWENLVAKAGQQARRSRIPVLGPLLEGTDVTELCREPDTLVIVLDETGHADLRAALQELGGLDSLANYRQIAIVIGPEGGFSDAERNAWFQAGAVGVRLGEIIMRASSAGPALLAVLNHLLKRW